MSTTTVEIESVPPAQRLKASVRGALPKAIRQPVTGLWRIFARPADTWALVRFASKPHPRIAFGKRAGLAARMLRVGFSVQTAHSEREALAVIEAILAADPDTAGVVVEAGAFKGASSAKFSLAAQLAGRKLVIFDSFEGIPENDENHGSNIYGGEAEFPAGSYLGTLDEVKRNIARFGAPEVCEFRKGWFEDTMPGYDEPIAVAYLDVDLVSSTKTCLKHLFPQLVPGAVVFSQDGHLPLVIEAIDDDSFWQSEVGLPKPRMDGLRTEKLVRMYREP
jgi:O-methyltransferase